MNKEDIISIVPLLPAQQFMLSASLKGNNATYVQQLLFEINDTSFESISQSLSRLSGAYEILSSIILYEGLKQAVWVSLKNKLPRIQKHFCEIHELDQLIEGIRNEGFDLQKESAIRFDWIESGNTSYLLISNHHILFDGWGRQQLLGDFIQLLQSPKLFLPHRNNKSWHEGWKKLKHQEALESYEQYLLTGDHWASFTEIPDTSTKLFEIKSYASALNIQRISKSLGLTQAEYINFVWTCFMAKWTQNPNVQFGVIKQNGLIEQVPNGFGLAIQTLPLQFIVPLDKSPLALIESFKKRERQVAAYPFVDTTQTLFNGLIYPVIIAFENYPLNEALSGVTHRFNLKYSYDYSEFPLSIAITPGEEQHLFQWHANGTFHSQEQIETISNAFISFLNDFENHSNQSLFQPHPATFAYNNPDSNTFFERIEKQLAKENRLDDYKEISICFLEKKIQRIWIFGDKHEQMDLLLLSAWKTEVEVLMVNEKESDNFIEELYKQNKPDVVFSSVEDSRIPNSIHLNNLQLGQINQAVSANNDKKVALSICTSGSTGKPKVVQLSLFNLLSFFEAWEKKLPWREEEHFGIIAHPAFDIGVAELIFPLLKGWKRTIISKEILSNTDLMRNTFSDITAFHMVPALLESWLNEMPPDKQARLIMTGGDKVPARLHELIDNKFSCARLFQFYGPSECSVLASGFENKGQFNPLLLPLGTKFEHAMLHVLSPENRQNNYFQEGEIAISGPCVGIGYATENEANNFIQIQGSVYYKTGDLGMFDPQGNLYFRGRNDQQVKINGQRIELSRIEQALIKWSGINQWVVIYDAPMLAAFYTAESSVLPHKEKLLDTLPAYAIPQWFQELKSFPLNKNGKIDLGLLKQKIREYHSNTEVEELSLEFQKLFLELFPSKSIDSRLAWFANGFNSIDAMKLSGKVKKELGQHLAVNVILSCAQLGQLPKLSIPIRARIENEIRPGQWVHEAASRIFFLSESDPRFAKSYWISSGIKTNKNIVPFIEKWIQSQKNLALCVESDLSKYRWKYKPIAFEPIDSSDKMNFIDLVQNATRSPFEHLIYVYYHVSDNQTLLAISAHHGLLDGLGMQQLLEAFHQDLSQNRITPLRLMEPNVEEMNHDFWENYLDPVRIQKLPFERIQPNTVQHSLKISLNEAECKLLKTWKEKYNCSTYEAGLIGWSQLWYHYFPGSDFSTGVIVSSRDDWQADEIVAMSSNSLPFVISSNIPSIILDQWRLLSTKVKEPFAEIAKLARNKHQDGTPFFNTSYVHNQWKDTHTLEQLHFELAESAFDLSLDFIEENGSWSFQWEFDAKKFSSEAIKFLHSAYFNLPQKLEVKATQEALDLKWRWNSMVEKNQNNIALVCQNQSISYSELNRKVQEIEKQYTGYQSGIIPLILERDVDSIAHLMSLFIAGIPFIPIDAETPNDRIEHIQNLCGEAVRYPHSPIVLPKTNPAFSEELCYAIATSGTTGIPKLVGVKRSGFSAAIRAWEEQYELCNLDKILQAASCSFDVFLGDIGRSLFQGATLVMLDAFERKDPNYMLETIKTQQITVFETTPLIARWWLSATLKHLDSLRLLIIGSDSWRIEEMEKLNHILPSSTKLISSYGLSETTIDNSFFTWRDGYSDATTVPIGTPMKHSEITIVTEHGNPLPQGNEGLLCIDGPCVGMGYFQDQTWSHKGGPWITADRGTVDEFGQLHFLGRADKQVKIRGQRLELPEIERIIHGLKPTYTWVSFAYETEFSSELGIAYQGDKNYEMEFELQQKILGSYPSYYLPSVWIAVAQFTMNQNGKISSDPLIAAAKESAKTLYSVENTKADFEGISSLMKGLFNKDINPEDHFFTLGLSSFDAMYFVREWNAKHPKKLQVFQLFSEPNFGSLSKVLMHEGLETVETFHQNEAYPANAAQEALWFEIQHQDSSLFNLPHFLPLDNILSNTTSDHLKQLFERVLIACPALFVRFEVNEIGELYQIPLTSEHYTLPIWKLSKQEFSQFQQDAYYKYIDLQQGPAFEASWITCEEANFLYFNPHHMVFDGGSDQSLLELFQILQKGETPPKLSFNKKRSKKSVHWSPYFELSGKPKLLKGEARDGLVPNIISALNKTQINSIAELQSKWKTSPSVIFSLLLGEALKQQHIDISWISLVVDTRDQPEVGMYMRAFPFPSSSSNPLNVKISRAKAALEFIYKHKEAHIQYPENQDPRYYHQIGLIIQHPISLVEGTVHETPEATRPRLPLSLYVEKTEEKYSLRWEFNPGYFNKNEVEAIATCLLNTLEQWVTLSIEAERLSILSETPMADNKGNRQSGIVQEIWEKYLGINSGNDFFQAGGTSLKALMMLNELQIKTSKKISISEFFKMPKFEVLSDQVNEPSKEWWWEMSHGQAGEDWYFPPIFGLGLVFNSYSIRTSRHSIAFNYPSAIGQTLDTNSIESLAELLLSKYLEKNKLPKKIDRIVAYSMGAIVAFEVIKQLELRGTKVEELIIWDKPAQIKYEPEFPIQLHPSIIHYVEQLAFDHAQREKMLRYLTIHQEMIEHYQQKGRIESNIQLYYCKKGFEESAMNDWCQLTNGKTTLIELPAEVSHYDIPTYWKSS